MIINRLLEEVWKLQAGWSANAYKFNALRAGISDERLIQGADVKVTRSVVFEVRRMGGPSNEGFIRVGTSSIDMNDMVLSINYDAHAPWWAVKPFAEVLEGVK